MKLQLICLLSFFSISTVWAQHQLRGKVLSSDQEPIPFISVSIYPLHDSTAIKGTITDDNGNFSFSKVAAGNYQLTLQMLAYEDWTRKIELTTDLDLGTILLQEAPQELATVEVVAEQSVIESHLGKKVLRIGKDLSATGSNVLEALEIIPSISTSPRGQVQVRGNPNVVIYINGKETKRDPSTLKFIAAESLEKIEVITNPSAQYDAEGIGGIINIVYKRSKWNACKLEVISSLSVLTDPFNLNPNGGANFNWTKKNFSIYTNLNYEFGKYEDSFRSIRVSDVDDLRRYTNWTKQEGMGSTTNALLGVSLEPDSTTSMALETNFARWDFLSQNQQQSIFNYYLAAPDSILIRNERGEVENELWINFSFEKTLAKEQTFRLSLTAGGEDEDNFTKSENLNLADYRPNTQQFLASSDELEKQRYYHATVDYEMPFGEWGGLQVGLKADYIRYHIFQKIDLYSDSILLADNDFNIDLQKIGGYLIQRIKFKNLEGQLGARLEQFSSEALQNSNGKFFRQNYTRLFPSLQVNYLIDDHSHTIGLNFSQRINRPSFFDLNPYLSYEDPLNLEVGNPALEPEIADLLEVNYRKEWNRFSMDLVLYNRVVNNAIQTVITSIDADRTLASTSNIGKGNRRGVELQLEGKLAKVFKTSATVVLAEDRYQDVDNEIVFDRRSTWSVRFKQELKLKQHWKIECSQIYRAPSYQIQQKEHENYYLNVGLSKKFKQQRGSISLVVRDLFNTRRFISSLHSPLFEVERSYQWQTRQIVLGVKYVILDKKVGDN